MRLRSTRPALVAVALACAAARLAAQAAPAAQATGEVWQIVPLPQSSLVYARDGSLIGEIGKQWRTSVNIATIPKYVGQAFIAVEDHRFYQHDGVDMVGVMGAIKGKLLGQNRGGASTITQQLVGNMHPDLVSRRDMSLGRKLKEQSAAREMERHYTKEQILEGYLNTINFGHGWFGIEAAARHYFGKPAARLTIAEAASLAAMPKAPATYDPAAKPGLNLRRRNVILDLMVEQGFIPKADAERLKATPVTTVPNGGMSAPSPYFIDVVRKQAERAGIPVMQGGYRVYTTLDPGLQRAAVTAVVEGTAAIEGGARYTRAKREAGSGKTDYLQAMAIAMDAATGDVRALVGGRNYAEGPFNRAVDALRQPGSSIKPFVYAAAMAGARMTPLDLVGDTAITIEYPGSPPYSPKNADGEFLGVIPMREALARSRNPVAVQLFLKATPDSVLALVKRAGIEAPMAPYPSSALGASVVQPLDMVAAYSTFANLGTPVRPRFVNRVDDARGRTVWSPARETMAPAMDSSVAFVIRDMMRDVVERGTGGAVRRYVGPQVPVAGKTGTTDNNTDVWFVGMTPDIVGAVWLGFDRPKTIARGAAGGTLAAPIWGRMMAAAGRGAREWVPPASVAAGTMDRETRAPATDATPVERRYTEYFLPGTQPRAVALENWKRWRWLPDAPAVLP
ncbi:MAG: PBP1A family penicillin-binding protein [Gemmatimonadetes bacterium]|nr:PBP1A family penicillin-binding protein [Gemmatimonadota bacterium]